jgi:hypothetical protein
MQKYQSSPKSQDFRDLSQPGLDRFRIFPDGKPFWCSSKVGVVSISEWLFFATLQPGV